jgi:hypothetical protein
MITLEEFQNMKPGTLLVSKTPLCFGFVMFLEIEEIVEKPSPEARKLWAELTQFPPETYPMLSIRVLYKDKIKFVSSNWVEHFDM